MDSGYRHGPWAGFGSPRDHIWNSLMKTIKRGDDFYYGDHAYFGRGKFYRVTKNRFQHDGETGHGDMDRIKPFWERPKPWKKGGRNIILCPQSSNHHMRFGEPDWEQRVRAAIELRSDRPIITRTKKSRRPLVADLEDAHCVITHTSNAAVEAILNGVPAITTGDCCASHMSGSDPVNVEKPFYPDGRMEWASILANNQWTLDEIRRGVCWHKIQ